MSETFATFVRALPVFGGILLLVALPVVILARRREVEGIARRYLTMVAGLTLFCAAISASSTHLVNQCQQAGNSQCVDFGSSGSQVFVVGAFALVCAIKTIVLYRD